MNEQGCCANKSNCPGQHLTRLYMLPMDLKLVDFFWPVCSPVSCLPPPGIAKLKQSSQCRHSNKQAFVTGIKHWGDSPDPCATSKSQLKGNLLRNLSCSLPPTELTSPALISPLYPAYSYTSFNREIRRTEKCILLYSFTNYNKLHNLTNYITVDPHIALTKVKILNIISIREHPQRVPSWSQIPPSPAVTPIPTILIIGPCFAL